MSRLKQVISGSAWLTSSRVVVIFASFISTVVVSRALGPQAFGQLSYAIAFAAIFAPLGEFGLNAIVTKAIVKSPSRKGEILGSALLLRFAATAVSMPLGVVAIKSLRPEDSIIQSFVILLLFAEIFRAASVCSFAFEARRHFATIAVANSVIVVVFSALKVICVSQGQSLNWLLTIYALEAASYGPVFYALYRAKHDVAARLQYNSAQMCELGKRSYLLAASGVLALLNLKLDQVMIGEMLGDTSAGIYAAAVKISEFWYFIPALIATVIFPDLVSLRTSSHETYMRLNQWLLDGFAVLSAIAFAVVVFTAEPIIRVIYGQEYDASAGVLAIHIFGGIFVAMRAIASKWLVSEGIYGMSLVSHGIGAIANIILNLVLIPRYGVQGAAIATVVSYSLSGYFLFFVHRKTIPLACMMTRSLLLPFRIPGMALSLAKQS